LTVTAVGRQENIYNRMIPENYSEKLSALAVLYTRMILALTIVTKEMHLK